MHKEDLLTLERGGIEYEVVSIKFNPAVGANQLKVSGMVGGGVELSGAHYYQTPT